MKHILLILSLMLVLNACAPNVNKPDRLALINSYIEALNQSDFSQVSAVLNDSILSSEFEFIQSENMAEMYTFFQWDSVFSPTYALLDSRVKADTLLITLSKKGKRISFLHDSATVYKVQVEFKEDKIASLRTCEYVLFDMDKWQPRRDSLVAWINEQHPELSGFIFDQSKGGAQNYLKAIELYRNRY